MVNNEPNSSQSLTGIQLLLQTHLSTTGQGSSRIHQDSQLQDLELVPPTKKRRGCSTKKTAEKRQDAVPVSQGVSDEEEAQFGLSGIVNHPANITDKAATATVQKPANTNKKRDPRIRSKPTVNSGSQARENLTPSSEKKELELHQKESTNMVLQSFLDRDDLTSTKKLYQYHLLQWKAYCEERYDGDCSVSAPRILEYFKKVIFKRTVKRYVDPNIGYNGVVGLSTSIQDQSTSKATRELGESTDPLEWDETKVSESYPDTPALLKDPGDESDSRVEEEDLVEEESAEGEKKGTSRRPRSGMIASGSVVDNATKKSRG
ncbi:hypothetical protein BGZ46_010864 [Entomortierella lignicola]|nr:hypothetical protein BGZ46_010864 [Entomortierella lignicola]